MELITPKSGSFWIPLEARGWSHGENELVQEATGVIKCESCSISLPGKNHMGFYVQHNTVFYMLLLVAHFTIKQHKDVVHQVVCAE